MESIAKNGRSCQGFEVSTPALEVGANGLRVKMKVARGRGSHLDGVKRGTITTFSTASARRLREALFSLCVPESMVFGITLTVPWKAKDFAPLMVEWKRTFNTFQKSFARDFPHSAMIYRNELQKRGAPHVHAVCYIAPCDLTSPINHIRAKRAVIACSDGVALPAIGSRVSLTSSEANEAREQLQVRVLTIWLRSVKDMHGGNLTGFLHHGVKVDALDASECSGLFKYLADHSSKHKTDQLGYSGRQWGFINRANLKRCGVDELPPFVNAKQEAIFWRMIVKLTRYTIDHSVGSTWAKNRPFKTPAHPEWSHLKGAWKKTPPFSCVHKGGKRRTGVIFIKGGKQLLERVWRASLVLSGIAPSNTQEPRHGVPDALPHYSAAEPSIQPSKLPD